MRIIYATALALLSVGISLPAAADTLQMPAASSQPSEARSMEMPVRGMSKEQVRAMFGQPKEALPPVGDPPITRWVYDGYTVYFEYSYVIQSVVNR